MSCGLELPSSHFFGVGLTECLGYRHLEPFPCGVCTPSLVYRGLDPCPGIASTSRTSIVDLLNLIVKLVCLAVELQLALCDKCQELRSFTIEKFGMLYLGVARHCGVWL
jgi:hypothetical protein